MTRLHVHHMHLGTARRLTTALSLAALLAAAAAAPRGAAAPAAAFDIVANSTAANGGQNFNGAYNGHLVLTVPTGAAVEIRFSNKGVLPHSFQVITTRPAMPATAEKAPVFPGAESPNPTGGTPAGGKATIRFVAAKSGKYLIICGFPGHALLGMHGVLNVTPGAKPGLAITK